MTPATLFQSTHPRGVRLLTPFLRLLWLVSIHAPARGATSPIADTSYPTMFQSTHPRGVRHPIIRSSRAAISFNPRTREGCDRSSISSRHNARVSIHAPARGATLLEQLDDFLAVVSIHAPARGATQGAKKHLRARRFQSTHPRGVRQPKSKNSKRLSAFQSTHPRGVRPERPEPVTKLLVSIHAPARGATLHYS